MRYPSTVETGCLCLKVVTWAVDSPETVAQGILPLSAGLGFRWDQA